MNSTVRDPLALDLVAGLVTGALLLLIALVVVIGTQIGVRVSVQLPSQAMLGPYDPLAITFSEPVDGSLAMQRLSLRPQVRGKFEWVDLRTLRFIPAEPYQPGTIYELSFTSGPVGNNGSILKIARSWKFQIRRPLIVYLEINQKKRRLLTVEKESGEINPLTDDSFEIFDFGAARDGEFVIFSSFNQQKGMDLWRVNRGGGNVLPALECGPDRCSNPVISPDGRHVAYVREAIGPTPDLSYGAPRIHVLDVESKQDAPLYEDRQIIGTSPTWSPDGTRLSSYDGIRDEFRLLDTVTGDQSTIPSQIGGPVSWSADSSLFIFTDLATNESGNHTRIRGANTTIHDVTTLFGEKDRIDYRYRSLASSPTGNALVIGFRPNANNPQEVLWMMDPATLGGQAITEQPGYIYNNPRWDPWGKMLIFERFKLKEKYKPEIDLWQPGMETPRVVAEGTSPQWLP